MPISTALTPQRTGSPSCSPVTLKDGTRAVGEAGGDKGDLSQPKTDAEIEEKFRALAAGVLGAKRVDTLLDTLWKLDGVEDVSRIPPLLVFA